MSGEHSVISPSKGEMILNCAAALGASKGVVDKPSEFAAEGTAYHQVASDTLEALKAGRDASCADLVGMDTRADGFEFTITDENAAYAQQYVDHVRALGGLQFYEVRLDTSDVVGVPGQGGTSDAVILDFENDTIRVRDLKFGMRPVYAPGNKQYLQYGAAALFQYDMLHDWKFIEVGTCQPRVPGGNWDTHTYPVEEVFAWIDANREKFARAYHLYLHPEQITPADFNPTEKGCEWCPIRGSCAARNQKFINQFPVVSAKPLINMTNAELGEARLMVEKFEAWASSIKQEAHNRAVNMGQHVPGWKVVPGRKGHRKLNPAAPVNGGAITAKELLDQQIGEDAYEPAELKTASALDTLLNKKKHPDYANRKQVWDTLQDAISQSEGSPSLVRDDSVKPAIKSGLEFPIQSPVV